ncbi:hypothetical protein [Desulfosporosinus sp. FKB]|uniref:hypothetical protein n=1 Tax=Desulfosporosinus sp. FKB TaxID=1969835 RepID=UPI000B49DE0E|nr:hypothetical protein [Desulfosporosinus sp. FKB]
MNNNIKQTKLYYFNNDLEKLSEIQISGVSAEAVLGYKKLFIYIFQKEFIAIDIQTLQITAKLKRIEGTYFGCIDAQERIMMLKGSNTIEVYDFELNLISRHRLKGEISEYYHNVKGNACFLTSTRYAFKMG